MKVQNTPNPTNMPPVQGPAGAPKLFQSSSLSQMRECDATSKRENASFGSRIKAAFTWVLNTLKSFFQWICSCCIPENIPSSLINTCEDTIYNLTKDLPMKSWEKSIFFLQLGDKEKVLVIARGEEHKVRSEAKKFMSENEEHIKKEGIFSFRIDRFLISEEKKDLPKVDPLVSLLAGIMDSQLMKGNPYREASHHLTIFSKGKRATDSVDRNFECKITGLRNDENLIKLLRERKSQVDG